MAQNFLYMFEFVVDDLLVTRPNFCAPPEYPVCCEISFRNSVYINICDHEFGQCIDPMGSKCGKCCLFSLESPISDADRLQIHIYKKRSDKCKFLVGCTDMPVRSLFDKVMESFNIENSGWEDILRKFLHILPKPGTPGKAPEVVDNDCDEDADDRPEQLCPTSELTKRLLPIFNLKGCQTGNIVLIIRLVANGPSIVSTFPFGRICNTGCCKKPPGCSDCPKCPIQIGGSNCRVEGGGNDEPATPEDEKRIDGGKDPAECSGSKAYRNHSPTCGCCPPLKDPCLKVERKVPCQRYFACNADKGCPCDDVEDECARAAKCRQEKCCRPACPPSCSPPCPSPCSPPPVRPKPSCPPSSMGDGSMDECALDCEDAQRSCSADTCDDTVRDPCDPCGVCMQPCFVTPRPPDPSPDAYDEFEACLNGSGLTIRVLKDSHCVESVCDGTEVFQNDSSECCDDNDKEGGQCPSFARNFIKRRTGGHIINHPRLPKIRANIKYSGNDTCCAQDYHVPYSKIKKYCVEQDTKVNSYRSRRQRSRAGACSQDCTQQCKPVHPDENRSCCVQVDKDDIRNTLKGINMDNKKKGIEVCYKTCDETDTDVFLVKLGSKQKCQRKRNIIEVELKTPKVPIVLTNRRVTTETQINEEELDAALQGVCKQKKPKKAKKKKAK